MLRLEARGAVLWMTLARPAARNAFDLEMLEALTSAWRRLRDDDALWLGVVTGEGDAAFSSGGDLKKLPGQLAERRARGQGMPETLFDDTTLDKPVVCALNGDAVGGGLELALLCDLRIAASHARLGLPEARWGILPAGGGTQRLPRVVGHAAATRLLLTAELIGADEALRIGLVDEVVAPEQLVARTERLCSRLLRNAPLSLRALKRLLRAPVGTDLAGGLAAERREVAAILVTADAREGPRAFAERREPTWTAR